MASATEPVGSWLAEFVATESAPAQMEVWVDHTAGAILAETPEVADDAVLADLLRASVKGQICTTEMDDRPKVRWRR